MHLLDYDSSPIQSPLLPSSHSPHLFELCTTLSVIAQHLPLCTVSSFTKCPLALCTVKFGCQRRAVART
ncbi:hypothetical protein BHM03_00016602 [Ensete ventricosum]|nr:hypothetical protein BHM03_00016602 [Ensete ventricosum]